MSNNINGNITNNKDLFKNSIISLSLNKIGTSKFQSIFDKYDLDHDGKLNTSNSQGGVNELELFQKDYEKIMAEESNNSQNAGLIKELYTNIVNFLRNGNRNGVYKDGKELNSNGKIDEETHQSDDLGNCWLLSKVNALSGTDFGEDAIKNAISKDSEGNYIVKLKEPDEEFVVTPYELQEAVDTKKYSDGDLDMLILELGFEKAIEKAVDDLDKNDIASGKKYTQSSQEILKYMNEHNGEWPKTLEGDNPLAELVGDRANLIKRLTGLNEQKIDKENPELEDILRDKSQKPGKIGITFGSSYDIEKREKFEDNDNHEYSIKEVKTDKNGKITNLIVINPWNNKNDIEITFEEFKAMLGENIEVFSKDKTLTDKYSQLNDEYKIDKFINSINNLGTKDPHISVEIPEEDSLKKEAIKKIGGYNAFMNKMMDLTQNYIELEDKIYKEKGSDELLKFHGYNIKEADEETRKIYEDSMKAPLDERIKNYKQIVLTSYCSQLGFSEEEINQIKENPEKAQEICKKYGYEY